MAELNTPKRKLQIPESANSWLNGQQIYALVPSERAGFSQVSTWVAC